MQASPAVDPAAAASCLGVTGLKWEPIYVTLDGYTYFKDCTGTTECQAVTDPEVFSTRTKQWVNLKEGNYAIGPCDSATNASTKMDCTLSQNNSYRALGIVSIFWANGTATLGQHEYSPTSIHGVTC